MNDTQLIWFLNSVRMLLIFSGNWMGFFPNVTVPGYVMGICLARHKIFSSEEESVNTGRPDLADT